MAEVVGLTASLVTLFALCIDGFEFLQAINNQTEEFRKLTIRLTIEKCRLFVWGEGMGFCQSSAGAQELRTIRQCRFPEVIEQTLRLIRDLLDLSEQKRAKYGIRSVRSGQISTDVRTNNGQDVLRQFNSSFGNFKISNSRTLNKPADIVKKFQWAIYDAKKFARLVDDIKGLIDSIQELTKDVINQNTQQDIIGKRLQRLNDIDTLEAVAEFCIKDYPSISDAVSIRIESLSSNNTVRRGILEWTSNLDDDTGNNNETDLDTLTIEALEPMTLTEMKHLIVQARLRKPQLYNDEGDKRGETSLKMKNEEKESNETDAVRISQLEDLVKKQRAMILEMNQSLEKTIRERDETREQAETKTSGNQSDHGMSDLAEKMSESADVMRMLLPAFVVSLLEKADADEEFRAEFQSVRTWMLELDVPELALAMVRFCQCTKSVEDMFILRSLFDRRLQQLKVDCPGLEPEVEVLLGLVAQANKDPEFSSELSAALNWFEVLNDNERLSFLTKLAPPQRAAEFFMLRDVLDEKLSNEVDTEDR